MLGHRPRDQRRSGSTTSITACRWPSRFHHNKPPTILDAPPKFKGDAVNLPDPETPTGVRGVGEPPVGAAYGAVMNAIAAAVGDEAFRRSPVTPDMLLMRSRTAEPDARGADGAHLGQGPGLADWGQRDSWTTRASGSRAVQQSHVERRRRMAVIRDVMPAFELFQPASVDEALRAAGAARGRRAG